VRNEETKRVIAHVKEIFLLDVKFKVSQKGRARVLREKQKNVHAGVQGFWLQNRKAEKNSFQVVYDPYKYDSFVFADTLKPCLQSNFAFVTIHGAFIYDQSPCP
jgi:hypothetical protein